MADHVDRLERDRALFSNNGRRQLMDSLSHADPRAVADTIAKAIELQVVTEELARDHGIDIDEDVVRDYLSKNRQYIDQQVERAITGFICSIVSREG